MPTALTFLDIAEDFGENKPHSGNHNDTALTDNKDKRFIQGSAEN